MTNLVNFHLKYFLKEEERLTAELDDEAKQARQQEILEARHKMLEQSNKERETELQQYLNK